uniref:Uncharacterized protein n=1 Tax=Rhizophora mucronata TaxID=61149 RepID=A0A2P2QTN9_RHIMU
MGGEIKFNCEQKEHE